MSYILEAIKRSERERLSASVSRMPALPVFGEAAKQSPLLLYGAISAALVAAGIAIGWLRPWQQSGNAAVPPVIAKAASESNTPVLAADVEGDQAGTMPLAATPAPEKVEVLHIMKIKPYRATARARRTIHPAAKPSPAMAAAKEPAAAPASPVAAVAPPVTAAAAAPPPPRASAVATVASALPAAASAAAGQGGKQIDDRLAQVAAPATSDVAIGSAGPSPSPSPAAGKAGVVSLYDLPPEILRKIPPMSISGFTYSDTPTGRMVDINDRLLQEGQYVADGLKLEQITPDGLIFSYRHYRFRKNLQ